MAALIAVYSAEPSVATVIAIAVPVDEVDLDSVSLLVADVVVTF